MSSFECNETTDIHSILIEAINDLQEWIHSNDFALIALSGGYELTLRDMLLNPIQKRLHKKVVKSECVNGAKGPADIGIIGETGPDSVIEFKHEFMNNVNPEFGLARCVNDFDKWNGIQPKLLNVAIVTSILGCPKNLRPIMKRTVLRNTKKSDAYMHSLQTDNLQLFKTDHYRSFDVTHDTYPELKIRVTISVHSEQN